MRVTFLDSLGNDLTVVNAARVSFAKESEEFEGKDEKLLGYLASHGHWTPFSQVQYQVRIKAPIFIARQWFKHMIGLTRNEVSRRYVSDAPEFYTPGSWRGRPDNMKQGSQGDLDDRDQTTWNAYADSVHKTAAAAYMQMVEEGVCPEQARMLLPQSMYTEWVETGSLAAAARICKQRLDPHAQVEIQELAKLFEAEVECIAPVSWGLLT